MSLDEAAVTRMREAWGETPFLAKNQPSQDAVRSNAERVGAVDLSPSLADRARQDPDLLDFYSQKMVDAVVERAMRRGVTDTKPVALPDKSRLDTWLIYSDAHVPFEKKEYLDLVNEIGRTIRPHGIAVIGDFGDLLSVSSHPKLPHHYRWQLKDEVEAVNARLDQIDAIGAKERRFFIGNHDIRGQRTAMKQMIGLYDSLDPVHLYKLKERGWISHAYQEHAQIGKIWGVHDSGNSGKYAVWQNGDMFGASTMQGHVHNAGCQYFGTVLGERHVSATLGWLGDERYAEYLAPIKKTRNWQHAFGVMYVERDTQNSHLNVVPIADGRCVVGGQLFEARSRA
jgi:hypothetical protein